MPCLVNKLGYSHLTSGINCQDSGCVTDKIKFVADGCGASSHSEVGAQLAALFMNKTEDPSIIKLYNWMMLFMFHEDAIIRDYFLFTTLLVKEFEDQFQVSYIGDGYVITINHDDKIEYINLEEPGMPPAFGGYNFVNSVHLSAHKHGVEVKYLYFPKTHYKIVGVATDGLRFIHDLGTRELFHEFETLLLRAAKGCSLRLKLFINKYHSIFQDDITIAI